MASQTLTEGNSDLASWQTMATVRSSTTFSEAALQISFSMSAGLGILPVSKPCGHMATALSQYAVSIVLQSGLNFTEGNFVVITRHTSSTALSSICFCDATSQISFSMSAGLGLVLGHMATALSQYAVSIVLQSGLNFTEGNFVVITW